MSRALKDHPRRPQRSRDGSRSAEPVCRRCSVNDGPKHTHCIAIGPLAGGPPRPLLLSAHVILPRLLDLQREPEAPCPSGKHLPSPARSIPLRNQKRTVTVEHYRPADTPGVPLFQVGWRGPFQMWTVGVGYSPSLRIWFAVPGCAIKAAWVPRR